jgi:prolyl oligopeptidase
VDDITSPKRVKSLGPVFDESKFVVESREATSKDGTLVHYFVVRGKETPNNGPNKGKNPTLLYGYGGFNIAMTPSYLGSWGRYWLEMGGVYVLANIRGGGEFGAAWHQAALKENRQRAYDDFIAVAEDLVASGLTSPEHLGIRGGSNGGLLMGVMATQRPDLFNAVVCEVPLLDMLAYTQYPPGASWVGEYGDPAVPAEREFIAKYSPYQNLKPGLAKMPPVFFVTSTKDDRVHPSHARKMAAKMEAFGYPYYYFENTEGGHGASADLKQRAYRTALTLVYLHQRLGSQ